MNIRTLYFACVLLFFQMQSSSLQELQCDQTDETVVLLNKTISTTCTQLKNIWDQKGRNYPEELHIITNEHATVDYEAVLDTLDWCITAAEESNSHEEQLLGEKIKAIYQELLDQYKELCQKYTRRIKCSSFSKVTTNELVTEAADIAKLFVRKNLRIGSLSGALIADDGTVTTGAIPATALPSGAVSNEKIANNAVTTNKIAPLAITSDLLAFNALTTAAGEPKTLRIYRGAIAGTNGAIISGAGFSVSKNGNDYTINLSNPYTDAQSYQTFIQLVDETGAALVLQQTDGTTFVVTNATNQNFSFFTIGS